MLEERFELSFSFEKKILSLPRMPIPPFELVEDNRVELFSGVYKTHALTDELILYKIYFKQKNKKSKYFLRLIWCRVYVMLLASHNDKRFTVSSASLTDYLGIWK